MASDFNKPTVTSLYTGTPGEIRENVNDVAKMFEGSSGANIPDGAKRLDNDLIIERYSAGTPTELGRLLPSGVTLNDGATTSTNILSASEIASRIGAATPTVRDYDVRWTKTQSGDITGSVSNQHLYVDYFTVGNDSDSYWTSANAVELEIVAHLYLVNGSTIIREVWFAKFFSPEGSTVFRGVGHSFEIQYSVSAYASGFGKSGDDGGNTNGSSCTVTMDLIGTAQNTITISQGSAARFLDVTLDQSSFNITSSRVSVFSRIFRNQ